MEKVNLKKEFKAFYHASAKKPSLLTVPPMNFLMIDGKGNPNTSQRYREAVEALYALAYALKFKVKKGSLQIDYGVMPLEGLWWAEDMASFDVNHKEDWLWTMMIMQPEWVTKEMVEETRSEVQQKKDPPALPLIRFESFEEGASAQVMHIGPFSAEGPTIEGLHQFIEAEGHQRRGKHHEIYLSDIRRAAPEKWKTIIRQPVSS
jgi:hypothetical protein